MFKKADDEKIGKYLNDLINERFGKTVRFCEAYIFVQQGEFTDDDVKRMKNRFSQILKGKKGLQTYDLPIISDILGISCEEILSAGKCYVPTSTHVTNYDIASSDDPEIWEKYMKRPDRLFLNCDEYCKSVIDYALEFKNYKFMKYLLDNEFIWFVNPNKDPYDLNNYGAGTSVKPNWDRFNLPDGQLHNELLMQDKLRTQTIALAIENEDTDILDSLLARENPQMHYINAFGNYEKSFDEFRNTDLIEAVAFSDNEKIIDYFSDEFTITNLQKDEYTFLFPFLNDVIELMLKNGREKYAEIIIRKVLAHNKYAYEKITECINEAIRKETEAREKQKKEVMLEAYSHGVSFDSMHFGFKTEDEIRDDNICCFNYREQNDIATFFSMTKDDYATNILSIKCSVSSPLKELVDESNEWYNKIVAIKAQKEQIRKQR